MPSARPMFDWHEPLCDILRISEDSTIDEISEALEEGAAKEEFDTSMYAYPFRQR